MAKWIYLNNVFRRSAFLNHISSLHISISDLQPKFCVIMLSKFSTSLNLFQAQITITNVRDRISFVLLDEACRQRWWGRYNYAAKVNQRFIGIAAVWEIIEDMPLVTVRMLWQGLQRNIQRTVLEMHWIMWLWWFMCCIRPMSVTGRFNAALVNWHVQVNWCITVHAIHIIVVTVWFHIDSSSGSAFG